MQQPETPLWYSADMVDIAELRATIADGVTVAPSAIDIQHGVPIYHGTRLRLDHPLDGVSQADQQLLGELAAVLADGPGLFVIKAAIDQSSLDAATEEFVTTIAAEKGSGLGAGDHFAAEGVNDRVWNAMEKLAISHPAVFADYFANEVFDVVSKAWLGPGYQITAQVNVVNPGGAAQDPHRDYHLGFMSNHEAEQFPAHVHHLSPALTLQGAVAHDDMPLEAGPTTYLPYSQKFGPGYVAWRRGDVQDLYRDHHVQLPLKRGDAVFFNPAVLHAAGTNQTTDRRRMANLLQISSAFGRAMEAMDRLSMCRAVVPVLRSWSESGHSPEAIDRVIAAVAEGYSFPSDLDTDQRSQGLHPPSQADLIRTALQTGQPLDELMTELRHKATSQRLR